ncbi:BRO-N domain-containing protein [Serratia fonticola]
MKAQTKPTVFSFEASLPIRMFSINGAPWFVAKDVCDAIGIDITQTRKLDAKKKGLYSMQTLGGTQDISVISESGLYVIILRCREAMTPGKKANRFLNWVTEEVLPAIRQTGVYQHRIPETLADLAGTEPAASSTMSVRDARRGKKGTSSKAASRIAESCVPVIMEAMRHQYHYANSHVGPDEVIPALLSDERNLQITALVEELADNGHDVSGIVREVEVMRYYILECAKRMASIATSAAFIGQQTKIS